MTGRRPYLFLALLIFPSLFVFAASIVFDIGLANTPFKSATAAGQSIGFDEPISFQNCAIILRHFSFSDLFGGQHLYDLLLLAMHFLGFALLVFKHPDDQWQNFWFFASQLILFPFAIFGLPMFVKFMLRMVQGRLERDDVSDIPFLWCTAHPAWLLTSTVIAIILGILTAKHDHLKRSRLEEHLREQRATRLELVPQSLSNGI